VEWDFGDGHTASGTLQPTHQYGDDGSYIVTLTVVDDDGGVGVDTLTVTVTNVAPMVYAGRDQNVAEGDTVQFSGSFTDTDYDTHTVEWDFGDGHTASGTLQPTHQYGDDGSYNVAPAVYAGPDQTVEVFNTIPFSGTFSDPGVLDTHTIDWDFGDGTGTTGSLTPTHIYNMVGNYTVTLKVTDKDGGVGTDTMNVEVIQKYAVWGNSNDAKAILWSGSGAKIKGNVNSNGGVTMSGSNNAIDGIVYYVSKLTISGSKDTFIRPMPVSFALADYQPGGKEAVKAQNAGKYHLVNGSFNVSTSGTVLDGLYYVKGNVALSGSSIKGTFTVVAEGTISISGSAMNSIAYSGGLLLFANGSSLAISGSNSTLGGIIYVPKGQIAISGNKINGGLFGDKITLSGSNMVITAN
jgi:PKD repeat protein